MLQAVIPRYGAPDVFEMRTAPIRRRKADPIRVRAAGGISPTSGPLEYPGAPKPPMVVNYEVVGCRAMGAR
jgi:hypothetical protein